MSIADLLRDLPENLAPSYNELAVSRPHYDRLVSEFSPQREGCTFAGIRVVPNEVVPEGYAVVKMNGEVVGVIDFKNGTATLTKPEAAQSAE